jgi:hypothetical protein
VRESWTTSDHHTTEDAVMASEIEQLPDLRLRQVFGPSPLRGARCGQSAPLRSAVELCMFVRREFE